MNEQYYQIAKIISTVGDRNFTIKRDFDNYVIPETVENDDGRWERWIRSTNSVKMDD